MTVVRVALKGVVESSVSQAAWVWVSEARHRRNLARASTAAAGEHGHRRRRRAAVTWLRRICCCFGHARRDKAELEDFKMFDDASRGLWGAMILIWEMKGRHTACLGAAIIILAHGFETFTQQMVTYEQRPMEYVNDTVRVAPAPPRSEVWDAYTKRGVGGQMYPQLSTKAAIYGGFLGSSIAIPEPTCLTANCSWPLIPTLAMCGGCEVTEVASNCSDAQGGECTYTMPSGTFIQMAGMAGGADNMHTFKVTPSLGNAGAYVFNATNQSYVAVFDLLSVSVSVSADDNRLDASTTASSSSGTSPLSGPGLPHPLAESGHARVDVDASSCALWFCLRALNVSIHDGRVEQRVAAEWHRTVPTDADVSYPVRSQFAGFPPDDFNVGRGDVYAVTANALQALRTFMVPLTFGTFSNGTVKGAQQQQGADDSNPISSFDDLQNIPTMSVNPTNLSTPLGGGGGSALDYSSDWMEALANATARHDLPGWVSRLADGMTAEVRHSGHVRAEQPAYVRGRYDGTALVMAPYVRVGWTWCAYPGVLIAASVLYWARTAAASERDGVSVWKSDSLPMLFCRIDPAIRAKVGQGLDLPGGLDGMVGKTRVTLSRLDDGVWMFKEDRDVVE